MIYLYDLIYMIPLCLLAETFGSRLQLLPKETLPMFLLSLTVMAFSMILRYCRGKLRLLLSLVPVPILLLFVCVNLYNGGGDGFAWMFAVGAMTVGIAWLVFQMQHVLWRRFVTLAVPGILIMGMLWEVTLPKWVFAISILPFLAGMVEEVQYHWVKAGEIDTRKHLVTIAPFLLLICLLVTAFPTSEKPFDWSFTVRLWERTADAFSRLQNFVVGEDDYDRQIGFSEDAEFSAGLSDGDPTEVMEVYPGKNSGSVLYLRGKTFDRFDGRSWKSTVKGEQTFRDAEYNETVRNINTRAKQMRERYMRRVDLKIRYLDFRTKYIFAPLNTNVANILVKGKRVSESGDDLLASSQLGYDTMYDISYYRLNQDDKEFQAFLRSEVPKLEKEPHDLNAAKIYRKYLPQTKLSGRAKTYIQEKLEGQETDYDRLHKLEELLSEMEYSLTPGKLPKNVKDPASFVDHLLFQSKKGYCCHYATAFVIIARSMGIPARYVQGYSVEIESERSAVVTSAQAHAWPEGYIEGFGWLSFEPTPGKKILSAWEDSERDATVFDPTSHYRKDGVKDHHKKEKAKAKEVREEDHGKVLAQIPWVLLVFVLLVCVALLLLFFGSVVARYRFRRLPGEARFRLLCQSNLKVLAVLGLQLEQGETLQEFRLRCGRELTEDVLDFLEDMQACLYGRAAPEEDMVHRAEGCMECLYRRIYDRKGKLQYFYWKYIRS